MIDENGRRLDEPALAVLKLDRPRGAAGEDDGGARVGALPHDQLGDVHVGNPRDAPKLGPALDDPRVGVDDGADDRVDERRGVERSRGRVPEDDRRAEPAERHCRVVDPDRRVAHDVLAVFVAPRAPGADDPHRDEGGAVEDLRARQALVRDGEDHVALDQHGASSVKLASAASRSSSERVRPVARGGVLDEEQLRARGRPAGELAPDGGGAALAGEHGDDDRAHALPSGSSPRSSSSAVTRARASSPSASVPATSSVARLRARIDASWFRTLSARRFRCRSTSPVPSSQSGGQLADDAVERGCFVFREFGSSKLRRYAPCASIEARAAAR